jgi:hypothetical protein
MFLQLNKRKNDGLRRDLRGTASVEAAIILPFFILIFAGVMYMERLLESKQVALVFARRCAWQYSNNGCSEKPTGCEKVVEHAGGSSNENEVSDKMREGGILDKLSDIPFIGKAISGLFGSALTSRATREVIRAPMFGGGTVAVAGHYYLMCNEKDQTLEGILEGMMKKLVRF